MGAPIASATSSPAPAAVRPVPRDAYPVEFGMEQRPVAVLSPDFVIVDTNARFEAELQVARADVVGRPLSLLWAFDPADHEAEVAASIADLGVLLVDAGPSAAMPDVPRATLQIVPIVDDHAVHLGYGASLVTERSKLEKRRVSLDAEGFQLSFDQLAVGMVLVGLDGYVMKCNPAMIRLFGRSLEEIAETDMITMIWPDDRARAVEQGLALITGEVDGYSQETRLMAGDGSPVWVYETATCVRDEDGNILHFVTQFADISDRKRAEAEREKAEQERNRAIEALLESQATIRFLFDGTPVPLVELDASLNISAANAALARLLGRDPIGLSITEVVHPDDMVRLAEEGAAIEPNTDWIIDIRLQRHDGAERLVRSHGRLHHDENGAFRSATATWHDITDAKEQEDRLRLAASTDPLTGLPHRATFLDRLEESLAASAGPDSIAVLFIDLDHFKPINDRYGHEAGDHLLCQVSRRLRTCVRSTDVVARIGGDEFVIMIDRAVAGVDPAVIGERIVERLAHPFATTYGTLSISASVGLAFGGPGCEPRDIVHRADLAAYQAKADGRSRLAVAGRSPA
jgi:diguanylate cyclase (GGDEF)-like protein/PAS domain S-box-containing protein